MQDVIRNLGKAYVYIDRATGKWSGRMSLKRLAAQPDEDVYLCEIVALSDDAARELMNKDKSLSFDAASKILYEANGIEDTNNLNYVDVSLHWGKFDILTLANKAGLKLDTFGGCDYSFNAVVINGIKQERTSKDEALAKKLSEKSYNKNVLNTFYAPSINAVLEKYGLKYNENGGIDFDSELFSKVYKEYLENNMVKELVALGIEVKINDHLAHPSSQGTYLRKVVCKKDMKILKGGN